MEQYYGRTKLAAAQAKTKKWTALVFHTALVTQFALNERGECHGN